MFIVDERIDIEAIRSYAQEFDNLPDDGKHLLSQSFKGGENVEYYTGLLAGLSSCYKMLEQKELDHRSIISGFMAVASKKILENIE